MKSILNVPPPSKKKRMGNISVDHLNNLDSILCSGNLTSTHCAFNNPAGNCSRGFKFRLLTCNYCWIFKHNACF